MTTFKWFASFVLAATIVSTLPAEPHCPGNVASVPLHLPNRHLMVVAVSVNHSGPYNFLLDTGTQFTIVDPVLAAGAPTPQPGRGPGGRIPDSRARIRRAPRPDRRRLPSGRRPEGIRLRPRPHSVDLHVRGVVGEDFLGHFDMLIDNEHESLSRRIRRMLADVKGPHIALLGPARAPNGTPALMSLIIMARLSNGERPVRLKLDSGTNVSFLFNTYRYMPLGLLRSTSVLGSGLDGAQHPFATMPPQDLQIGPLEIPRVSFFTFADSKKDSGTTGDGMLATGLFRRVFICHTHHFVVLDPR